MTEFAIKHPSRCPMCSSTNRERYTNRNEEECITTIGDGIPVTHRISQLTKCKDCGQARYDVSFENRPSGRVPPGMAEFPGDAPTSPSPESSSTPAKAPKPKPTKAPKPKPTKESKPKPPKGETA